MICHLHIASCELADLSAVSMFNFYRIISINDTTSGRIDGGLEL